MVFLSISRKVALLSVAFCLLLTPHIAKATSVYDSACDVNFMKALEDKAWMEAQREFMHNQALVWKPDSVITLGCYSNWISAIPKNFSFDGGSSMNAFNGTVNTYINSNFGHSLAGGHSSSAQNSGCGNIRRLWDYASCKVLNISQIQTLADAETNRPTTKPSNCSGTGSWGTPKSHMNSVAWGTSFDSMSLFTAIVAPLSEAGGNCSVGIPTGVLLGGTGGDREIVCPNPGCSPSGGTNPKCCKSGTSSNCSAGLP